MSKGQNKSQKEEIGLKVTFSLESFPVLMHFNRFEVIRDQGIVVLKCGLYVSELVVSTFSTVMSPGALEHSQDSLMSYLDRIRAVMASAPFTDNPKAKTTGLPKADWPVAVSDLIQMAHRMNEAETLLFAVPLFAAHLNQSDRTPVLAQPIALLRSELSVQRDLIQALYAP